MRDKLNTIQSRRSFLTGGMKLNEEPGDEGVADLTQDPAQPLIARIAETCLLKSGVSCQICTDTCEVEALRFNMRVRPAGSIELDNALCTGCAECVASCPTSAIVMTQRNQEAMA